MPRPLASWIKVDVKAPWQGPQQAAGREAVAYWLEGTCWASQNETDGELPSGVFSDAKLAKRLVDAGLWEKTPTGYREVGYLDRQTSSAQREKTRAYWRSKKPSKSSHHEDFHPGISLDSRILETEVEKETKVEPIRTYQPAHQPTKETGRILTLEEQHAEWEKLHKQLFKDDPEEYARQRHLAKVKAAGIN